MISAVKETTAAAVLANSSQFHFLTFTSGLSSLHRTIHAHFNAQASLKTNKMKFISITIAVILIALVGAQAAPVPASLVDVGPIDTKAKIPIDNDINILRRGDPAINVHDVNVNIKTPVTTDIEDVNVLTKLLR